MSDYVDGFSGTVFDALAFCVGPIVKQNTAAGDTVVGPVMDTVAKVGIWAFYVLSPDSIVELGGTEISHVPESIPLSSLMSNSVKASRILPYVHLPD